MKKLLLAFFLMSSAYCYAGATDTTILKTKLSKLNEIAKKSDSTMKADSVQKLKPILKPLSGDVSGYHVAPKDSTGYNFWGDRSIYPEDYISVKTDSDGFRLAQINVDTFRIWIDGICYPKIRPLCFSRKYNSVIFRLTYDTASTSPWQLFYAYPNYWTFKHHVEVKLGTLKTEFKTINKTAPTMELATTALWQIILAYLLFVLIIVVILRFGKGILRDVTLYSKNGVKILDEPTNPTKGILNIKEIPCSLARCQFLFWLLIIFLSILHIWGISDELTTPTGTVLLLLGISGGTFYIARVMDKTHTANPAPVADPPAVGPLNSNPAPVVVVDPATACVQEFIDKNYKSKGLMIDILTDGKSISLHRLQLVIFTTFLGIYFTWEVIYGLSLPNFSETMMLLMGISSGTYAGIKTLE